jgi:hypothetical protein
MPVPILPVVLNGMFFILILDAERRQMGIEGAVLARMDAREAINAIPTNSTSLSAAQNGQKQTPSCLALASVAYGEKVCARLLA